MPSDDTPPIPSIDPPVVDPQDRLPFSAPVKRTRRRSLLVRLLPVMIVVVALGGFVGLVAYYYMAAGTSGVAPLIKADQQPFKIKPENPGGMSVPDQDKEIYDRIGRVDQSSVPPPNTERLLPPPETPMAHPAPVPGTAPTTPPAANAVAQAPAPPVGAAPAASPAPVAAPSSNPNVGGPVLGTPPPQHVSTLSTVPPSPPGTVPPPQQPAAKPAPKAAPGRPAQTQTASVAPAAAAPRATGGPMLRAAIGSLRTEAEAKREWERQRRLYPEALAGVTPSYASIDLGSKGVYWRIYVGPAEPSAEARARCEALRQKKVDCFVARP